MGCCYTTGPNQALVKSGCCVSSSLVVAGGCLCIIPCCQQVQDLSLNTMTISIESSQVYTKQGVAISVKGIAQVKVNAQNKDMLKKACELFLDKSEIEVLSVARETMEGHQRAIVGKLTVEEILRDKRKFSEAVFQVASSDLLHMGLRVVSYTIKDVRDDNKYLQSLGMSRTAEAKRDARIGEAEAQKDAGIRSATAEWKEKEAKFENDILIAKAEKEYHLKAAGYTKEVQTKKAESDMAYDLQSAITKQKIMEEKMQIEVVERAQLTLIQEQEITRKQKELEASVKKPAEAEKYRLEMLAEAEGKRLILEAEAQSEAMRLKGQAEASAIEAKARADAEQMAKKAEAWKEYEDSAMLEMILDTMPRVAAEVSQPLCQTDRVVMVSSGSSDVGITKLTGEVLGVISKVPELIKNITDFDISHSMRYSRPT